MILVHVENSGKKNVRICILFLKNSRKIVTTDIAGSGASSAGTSGMFHSLRLLLRVALCCRLFNPRYLAVFDFRWISTGQWLTLIDVNDPRTYMCFYVLYITPYLLYTILYLPLRIDNRLPYLKVLYHISLL